MTPFWYDVEPVYEFRLQVVDHATGQVVEEVTFQAVEPEATARQVETLHRVGAGFEVRLLRGEHVGG